MVVLYVDVVLALKCLMEGEDMGVEAHHPDLECHLVLTMTAVTIVETEGTMLAIVPAVVAEGDDLNLLDCCVCYST